MIRPARASTLILLISLILIGCGPPPIDTTYGRSRGPSINGTGVLAELIREQGFEVRTAVRLTDTLSDWAGTLVRFSDHPGPPDESEGRWLLRWLKTHPSHDLIYVVRDFDAEPEFWASMLEAQAKETPPEEIERIKKHRDDSKSWVLELPPQPKTPAKALEWFRVDPKTRPLTTGQVLEGPWAESVDPKAAALGMHHGFVVEEDEQPVLLKVDGQPVATSWTLDNGSRVLALANASFLLNASLLNRARRPLAAQVVEWLGPGPGHVAFVEGHDLASRPDGEGSPSSSPFHLFQVAPFGRVATHILIFLTILALARAVRLGRPLAEPPSGVERPSAHPEALGVLLRKTRQAETARAILEAYQKWRRPSSPPSPRA